MASFDLVSLVRHALVEGGLLLAPRFWLACRWLCGQCSQSATGIHEPLIGMVPELWSLLVVVTGG